MKILAFTDIHGDISALKVISKLAKKENPEVLVCAGDISIFGRDLKKLISILDIGIPLLIIPGNHETQTELNQAIKDLDFVKNMHLKSKKINNTLFIGCGGGGFSPLHTPFEKSEKKFSEELNKFYTKKGKKVVLITHAPPHKTKLDKLGIEYVGSESIRKFIEKYKPNLCICGHIHENAGKEDKIRKTKIINPAFGKIINI